jgi:Cu-Zn family superoxide dismutase
MLKIWIAASAALAVAAPVAARPSSVAAELRDASGAVRARASVTQEGEDLRVRIEAVNMTPGAYGTHIHAVGRCDPPDFASAGPHWNPSGRQHGKENPEGLHKGDLPNLLVGADGKGSIEYPVRGAAMGALLDEDGAAVIVHAQADDYRTDPSGNSGARMSCGVLR